MCVCVSVCVSVVCVCVSACMCVYEVHMATPDIYNQMLKKMVLDLFIISQFNSLPAGLPKPLRSKRVLVVFVYVDV